MKYMVKGLSDWMLYPRWAFWVFLTRMIVKNINNFLSLETKK